MNRDGNDQHTNRNYGRPLLSVRIWLIADSGERARGATIQMHNSGLTEVGAGRSLAQ